MEKTEYFIDLGNEKKVKNQNQNIGIMLVSLWKEKKTQLIFIFMLNLSSISQCVFYFFKNQENLLALQVYSSFRRVKTGGVRNCSVATGGISWN